MERTKLVLQSLNHQSLDHRMVLSQDKIVISINIVMLDVNIYFRTYSNRHFLILFGWYSYHVLILKPLCVCVCPGIPISSPHQPLFEVASSSTAAAIVRFFRSKGAEAKSKSNLCRIETHRSGGNFWPKRVQCGAERRSFVESKGVPSEGES